MLFWPNSYVKLLPILACISKEMKEKPWVENKVTLAAQPTSFPLEYPADDRDLDFEERRYFPSAHFYSRTLPLI